MLTRNLFANVAGQGAGALLSLLSIPVFLHYIGEEGYGLIGFLAALQAVVSVLDLGLSTVTNREVARCHAQPALALRAGPFVRTVEVVNLGVAAAIATGAVVLSGPIGNGWINASHIPSRDVQLAIITGGLTLALRWPVSVYIGVILGLERHVQLNMLVVSIAVARSLGAILVVIFVSPTVLAYLGWTALVAGVEVVIMNRVAWGLLRRTMAAVPAIQLAALRDSWRFGASLGFNSLLAALLKQSDRLIIAKLLPLEQLAFYSAAHSAASALALVASPVATAAMPRFSALLAAHNETLLGWTYHTLVRMLALVIAPLAAVLVFFSYDLLHLWTRSDLVAQQAAAAFAVFAAANMLNGLMQLPFALQLAAGTARIAIWNNALSVMVLMPLTCFLVPRVGIVGGAWAWCLFNLAYYLVTPHVLHRHVLHGHAKAFVLADTLPVVLLALGIGWIARVSWDMSEGWAWRFSVGLVFWACYAAGAFLFSPGLIQSIRQLAMQNVARGEAAARV